MQVTFERRRRRKQVVVVEEGPALVGERKRRGVSVGKKVEVVVVGRKLERELEVVVVDGTLYCKP